MAKKIVKEGYNILGKAYYDARKKKKGVSYFFNENLEMPSTLRLIGKVKGKTILDLGCGPGIYADILTKNGAKVYGIDISNEMISLAKNEAPKAILSVGDAENLSFESNKFDIVFSALMMGHLESWNKVLSEVHRVLKKKGLFIFSVHNPVTERSKKSNWFFKTFREPTTYFNENKIVKTWEEEGKSSPMIHYHKTYQTIIKNLIKAGFEISDYEDCIPLAEMKKEYSELYTRAINVPTFCVWQVRKK